MKIELDALLWTLLQKKFVKLRKEFNNSKLNNNSLYKFALNDSAW